MHYMYSNRIKSIHVLFACFDIDILQELGRLWTGSLTSLYPKENLHNVGLNYWLRRNAEWKVFTVICRIEIHLSVEYYRLLNVKHLLLSLRFGDIYTENRNVEIQSLLLKNFEIKVHFKIIESCFDALPLYILYILFTSISLFLLLKISLIRPTWLLIVINLTKTKTCKF